MKKIKFMLLLVPLAFACNPLTVDESYDFIDKGIDTEMTILPGFTAAVSVDTTASFTISDLIQDNDLIRIGSNGDYSIFLQLDGENFDSGDIDMTLPGFSSQRSIHFRDFDIPENLLGPEYYDDILTGLGLSRTQNLAIEENIPIDLSTGGFPQQVTAISSASVSGTVRLTLTMEDKVHTLPAEVGLYLKGSSNAAEATCITLPEWLKFGAFSYENMKLEGNVLTCTGNVNLKNGLVIDLPLESIEVPESQGITTPGNFSLSGNCGIVGNVVLDFSGYNGTQAVVYSAGVDIDMASVGLDLNSATVEIDLDPDFGEIPAFELGDLQDLFSGEGTQLDFYDLWFLLDAQHNFPGNLAFGARINPLDGSDAPTRSPYQFSLSIPAGDARNICISEKAVSGYDMNVQVDGLSDIFVPIPAKVKISEVELGLDAGPVTVVNHSRYSADIRFALSAPLALGENARLSFGQSMDLKDQMDNLSGSLDGSVQIDTASVALYVRMLNSLPLDVNLSLVPTDAEGNHPFEGATKVIRAGTLDSPAELSDDPILITLPIKELLSIESFDISIEASASSLPGVTFNKDMSLAITIEKIALTADSGVTVNLGKNQSNNE